MTADGDAQGATDLALVDQILVERFGYGCEPRLDEAREGCGAALVQDQRADFSRMCTPQAEPSPMTWASPTLAPSICRGPASPRR